MHPQSLLSAQWLNAKRVLYMTHLAIGDYYYQRTYLAELKRRYPHLKLDIWIDDCRSRPKPWHAGRNQILCQWLDSEAHFNDIYPICSSRNERKNMIRRARQENYDIVIFMAHSRTENFAKIARNICPNGWVAGTVNKPMEKWLKKWWAFNRVDFHLNLAQEAKKQHIQAKYQYRFSQLFGFDFPLSLSMLPLSIPSEHLKAMQQWVSNVKSGNDKKSERLVLINHLSTNPKRDLPANNLVALIAQLHHAHPQCGFVINVPPNAISTTQQLISNSSQLQGINISLFSAKEHFFQLPALLSLSDVVITVETAVMHLASGLNVPQIVLMRENALQWQPLRVDELLLGKNQVAAIPIADILAAFARIITRL